MSPERRYRQCGTPVIRLATRRLSESSSVQYIDRWGEEAGKERFTPIGGATLARG